MTAPATSTTGAGAAWPARLAARVRFDAWRPPAGWMLTGLFTAACLMYFARNVRVADVKGAAQYHAMGDSTVSRSPADRSASLLVVDAAGGDAAGRAAVCAALRERAPGAPPVRLVWMNGLGAPAGSGCPASLAGALDAAVRRQAFSVMHGASLALLLVDGNGRYVYGGRADVTDARVLALFLRRP